MSSDQVTQNSILRISDKQTMQFLDLYEKEQCLWNTTLEEYKIKLKRQEAAERIAKTLNVMHFKAKHVIMKFRNLRSSYTQELKKIANSEAAGEDPVYRPKVFWFSKMQFVRPHLQLYKASKDPSSRKVSTISEEDDEAVQVKMEHDDSFSYEEHEVEPPEKRLRTLLTASLEDNDSNLSNSLGDNSSQPLVIPLQRNQRFESVDKYMTTSNNMPQDLKPRSGEYFSNFVKQVSTSTNTPRAKEPRLDDCFDSFGNYVAAMLKNMPVERAMAVQPEVVKLLVSGIIDSNEGPSAQSDQNENL